MRWNAKPSVDKVELVVLSLVEIIHLDGVALDRDAFFLLKIHIVQDLIFHIPDSDGLGELKESVGKGALAVVDMGDYAEVAYVFHLVGGIFFK